MTASIEREQSQVAPQHSEDVDKTHRVVVFARPDDSDEMGELLAERLHWHATDSQIAVHAMSGVLPERFSARQAAEVVHTLNSVGVTAAAVSQGEIPDLAHAQTIHHLRCRDEGLELLNPCGRPETVIAWPDVQLLSLGYVPLETSRHYIVEKTAVISAGPRTAHPPVQTPSKSGMEAWLFCKHTTPAYHIDQNQMNYEYLGRRKVDSATQNFRLLMEDVINRASDINLTPATRAFLLHEHLRGYEFASSAELQQYTLLHLLRVRLQLQQSQSDSRARDTGDAGRTMKSHAVGGM